MGASRCEDCDESLRDRSMATVLPHESTGFGDTTDSGSDLPRCPNPDCLAIVLPGVSVCPRCETAITPTLPPLAPEVFDGGEGDPSRVIGGKWKIVRRVASSSFGRFYEGRHTVLPLKVGIKVLRSRFAASEKGQQLFHREAMRVSLLHHPNIVKVFDFGDDDHSPFIVMQYLRGQTLLQVTARGGLTDREARLSPEDVVEVLRQVALALIEAHQGVDGGEPLVHLDLKPEHIFLERVKGENRWHVTVIDFGIAEIENAHTDPREGDVAGTPPFMAPERWRGAATPSCDIYALGVILYELIAGRLPFKARDKETWRKLHETHTPSPPTSHTGAGGTPALRDLGEVAMDCLAKDPADRPVDAEAFIARLDAWEAKHCSPPKTVWQRVGMFVLVPAAVLVLTALLVSVALRMTEYATLPEGDAWMTVGPEARDDVTIDVHGFGYDGGEVMFEFVVPDSRPIPVGTVRGHTAEIDLSIATIKAALGSPELARAESGYEARFVIEGSLSRELRTAEFSLKIDDDPPKLTSDRAPPGRPLRVWLNDHRFALRSKNDELKAASYTLGRKSSPSPVNITGGRR